MKKDYKYIFKALIIVIIFLSINHFEVLYFNNPIIQIGITIMLSLKSKVFKPVSK